jgi:hypothetical protein
MMQLLKRLLHPVSRSSRDSQAHDTLEVAAGERKTVLDLFKLDLKNLPLEEFTEGKMEVNPNGDMIQNYIKMLDYKECGVFDMVQVKLTGNKHINVVFRCSEPSMVNDEKLRALIDGLCDIYGHGDNQGGVFNAATAAENKDQQFYVMFGRNWMDYPKYKYPVSVRRYVEDVFISLWGFRLNEMVAGTTGSI